jgi:streptogramin lyase
MKPFGVAIDVDGNVWINDNRSDTISVISPKGRLIETLSPASTRQTTTRRSASTSSARRSASTPLTVCPE